MKKIERESKFSKTSLYPHIEEHREEFKYDPRFINVKTDEDFAKLYDNIADKLSKKYVNKSDCSEGGRFVGYIMRNGRKVKYDRQTHDFVVYDKYNKTMTFHKKSYKEYMKIQKRDFYREFPYNEDIGDNNEKR